MYFGRTKNEAGGTGLALALAHDVRI